MRNSDQQRREVKESNTFKLEPSIIDASSTCFPEKIIQSHFNYIHIVTIMFHKIKYSPSSSNTDPFPASYNAACIRVKERCGVNNREIERRTLLLFFKGYLLTIQLQIQRHRVLTFLQRAICSILSMSCFGKKNTASIRLRKFVQ
jgi:hypothetical protein